MKIIKSFRNTTVLNVDTNGEIIVKTPRFVSEKKVLDFIEKHKSWIEKRQNEILSSKKNFVE
jgi:predicted metal-dependent hydrolase